MIHLTDKIYTKQIYRYHFLSFIMNTYTQYYNLCQKQQLLVNNKCEIDLSIENCSCCNLT